MSAAQMILESGLVEEFQEDTKIWDTDGALRFLKTKLEDTKAAIASIEAGDVWVLDGCDGTHSILVDMVSGESPGRQLAGQWLSKETGYPIEYV